MATTNFGWILPTIDGSATTWGELLNDIIGDSTTIDPIDTVVSAIKTTADAALARAGGTMTGLLTHEVCRETIEPIAVLEVDWAEGNVFTKTVSVASTLTFANLPSTGVAQFITIRISAGVGDTVTWPTAVKWHEGSTPTQTSGGTDLYVLYAEEGVVYAARALADAS